MDKTLCSFYCIFHLINYLNRHVIVHYMLQESISVFSDSFGQKAKIAYLMGVGDLKIECAIFLKYTLSGYWTF